MSPRPYFIEESFKSTAVEERGPADIEIKSNFRFDRVLMSFRLRLMAKTSCSLPSRPKRRFDFTRARFLRPTSGKSRENCRKPFRGGHRLQKMKKCSSVFTRRPSHGLKNTRGGTRKRTNWRADTKKVHYRHTIWSDAISVILVRPSRYFNPNNNKGSFKFISLD